MNAVLDFVSAKSLQRSDRIERKSPPGFASHIASMKDWRLFSSLLDKMTIKKSDKMKAR